MRAIINCMTGVSMSRTLLTGLLICFAVPALADEKVSIAIRDDGFAPVEVEMPAGKKIELAIRNEQKSAAEFESHALRREKAIPPGAAAAFIPRPGQSREAAGPSRSLNRTRMTAWGR